MSTSLFQFVFFFNSTIQKYIWNIIISTVIYQMPGSVDGPDALDTRTKKKKINVYHVNSYITKNCWLAFQYFVCIYRISYSISSCSISYMFSSCIILIDCIGYIKIEIHCNMSKGKFPYLLGKADWKIKENI